MEAKFPKTEIEQLINRFYGLKTESIKFMDAYEGANIKITTKSNADNSCQSSDFVLKLSKVDPAAVELQISLIHDLNERGIQTLQPRKTLDGDFVFEHVCGKDTSGEAERWTVHMFHYLEGVTVYDAGNPESLYTEIGRFTGEMDAALKEFHMDRPPYQDIMWELTRLPELLDLLPQFCHADLAVVGKEIIDSYHSHIVPELQHLQRGFIHGDVNDCNILIQPSDPQNSEPGYKITGIIDFGDACVSYYVYELASIMADIMASTYHTQDIISVGKKILHGFSEEFTLNKTEVRYLRVFICVRLLQMFVLNSKAASESPDNKYLRLEIEESGKVCECLWKMTDDEFNVKFEVDKL